MNRFLVDAQLPLRLARLLRTAGYDTIHTRELPNKNQTLDKEINEYSIIENRIVITKDSDFLQSFLVSRKPYKLLLITTGNIKNTELETMFIKNLDRLDGLFEQYSYLELSREALIVHQ